MRAGRRLREPPPFSGIQPVREVSLPLVHQIHDKAALRQQLRRLRADLPALERHRAEHAAAQQARRAGWLKPGKRIAAYIPVGHEFSSWPLILLALQRGVEVYVPRVVRGSREMEFVRLDQQTRWSGGAFGIPEPDHVETCNPRQLDTVFLPLVGFDSKGFRLGQGGGYYDTTFAFRRNRVHWRKPRLVGLAFACQQSEHLPVDRWDLQLDAILGAG